MNRRITQQDIADLACLVDGRTEKFTVVWLAFIRAQEADRNQQPAVDRE